MPGQESQVSASANRVVFCFPRNWTAVVFFGLLGIVHWSMALAARRSGAQMSVIFGAMFITIAAAGLLIRRKVALLNTRRCIILMTTLGRRCLHQRAIPFNDVISVRVSLLGPNCAESNLVIVCRNENVELPPTRTPRQIALLLAMTFDVPLIRIYGHGAPPEPSQRIARLFRNEDAIE